MARATAEAGGVLVVSSNAGTLVRRDRRDRRALVAPGLPARRPHARRAAARPRRRGRRAGRRPHRRHPGRRHQVRQPRGARRLGHRRPRPAPGELRAPGTTTSPVPRRRSTSGRTTSAGSADRTGLPVVVKGVLRAEDAERSVQAGAAAVWVSNHGGRQLDRAASTASCLPGGRRRGRGPRPGVRRRRDPLRPRRARRAGPRRGRRLPRPAAAARAGRGRATASPRCTESCSRRPSTRSGWPAAAPSPTRADSPRAATAPPLTCANAVVVGVTFTRFELVRHVP